MIKEDRSVNPETGEDDHDPEVDYLTYDTIDGVMVQSKFVDIYNANKEFIGWLTIPDTNVDYPVMFTPADEQKYLHLDFDQNYSSSGTLFVAKDADPIRPSDNVLIYGHNMKAGTMFHSLLSYEKEDFYQAHKRFTFDTLADNGTYEVIAAFRTQIDEDNPSLFKYYESFNFTDEKSFNEYVEKAKSLTPYNIDTTAEYGDKLITLSTCAYHTNEGRYVIVAKKVKNAK
jgi:sortase B